MSNKISQFFSEEEFKCRCGKNCDAKIDPYFVLRLDEVRRAFGRPLLITSGVRCKPHNIKIGGAPESKHLLGIAADIYCENASDRYTLIQIAQKLNFNGIGVAHNFIHLDIRADDAVFWLYDFPKKTVKRA